MSPGIAQQFCIIRTFEAPRNLVFQAFTDPDHLMHWWGPKGFTWVSATLDLRPGGMFHYCMRSPGGQQMWGKFVYREIVPPERIVFMNSFSDENGDTIRAPFNPLWPLEILNHVTFVERGGRTTLTLRGEPINATEAERHTFDTSHQLMEQGFSGTLDQLADYLASRQGAAR